MQIALAPKMLHCKCGNTIEATIPKTWCSKCCQPVFYDEADQRKHQMNHYYMIGIMAMTMMLITYFFIEILAVPFFSN